jgi:hypothetical protein
MYAPASKSNTPLEKEHAMNDIVKTFADLKAAKGPKAEQPKPISSLQPKPPTVTKPQPAVVLTKKIR